MPTVFPLPANGPVPAFLVPGTPPGTGVMLWADLRMILLPVQPGAQGGPPPAPGPRGGSAASGGQAAPVLPRVDPALSLGEAQRTAIKAKARPVSDGPDPESFAISGEDAGVVAYDLRWARVLKPDGLTPMPDADLLRGLNLWLRLQRPGQIPTATPAAPPLYRIGDREGPYGVERARDRASFEYWANTLFVEIAGPAAKRLAGHLLQGRAAQADAPPQAPADPVNRNLRTVHRWLPRTADERLARDAERRALAADPAGPYRWLDDDEAAYALDFMRSESMWIMDPVADAGRAALLTPVGAGFSLPRGVAETDLFAYHATSRAPSVFTGGGRTCPTAAWTPAAELGADQGWHPLRAGGGWAGQPLFRRGNADNELTTTVSIAQSPVTALDFPLIQSVLEGDDAYRTAAAAGNKPALPDGDYPAGAPKFRFRGGRPVTDVWCYLLAVRDVYDTGALQALAYGAEKFTSPSTETWLNGHYKGHGELATTDVPPEAHLLGARYERVHYGTSREEGMRYCVRDVATVNAALWAPLVQRSQFGQGELPLLFRVFTDQLAHFPMCGVKRGPQMSDALYREALHDAYHAYGCDRGSGEPIVVPGGLVEEISHALTTVFDSVPRDLILKMGDAVVTAWKNATADLTSEARRLGAI